MEEQQCTMLELTAGKPKGNEVPATPPVKATAVCYARTLDECPKSRSKLEITIQCFRLYRLPPPPQAGKKKGDSDGT
jgi:hypothetical protein